MKDIISYIGSGSRAGIVATSAVLLFMLSVITLSGFVIYATYQGNMPDAFYSLKTWLRPVFAILGTLILLFYVACIAIDLVSNIKTRNAKEIAVSAIKMAVAMAIAAYILIDKWKWITE